MTQIPRYVMLILLLIVACCATAAEKQVLASWDGSDRADGSVAMELWLADPTAAKTDLVVTLRALPEGFQAYHLYPPDAEGGVPLAIELSGLKPAGKLQTDAKTKMSGSGDQQLKVYVDSKIEVRIPVYLPAADSAVTATFSYLACTDEGYCRFQVMKRPIQFSVSGIGDAALDPADQQDINNTPDGPKVDVQQLNEQKHLANAAATGIQWRHINTVAEVEEIITAAAASGKTVYLDFTGPSCINCQDMAKNVLVIPEVRDAWNSGIPVEINTDASSELAQWQLERFGTYTRPMYVRIDPDGTEASWNVYFSASNEERLQQLLAFLRGGAGQYSGSGDSWLQFILLALAGGLFTLVMPCTYPMIPMTVNFFNKQATSGKKLWPLALSYALGILISFTMLGVIVGVVLGKAITNISGDPWVNLVIALLFIVLGMSLLGVFFLRLPASMSNVMVSSEAGYIGALLMGLTFAVTAFTCTAPFAGAVLAEGAKSGDVLRPTIGMMIYASVIAVPFFFLSMSPKMLQRLPRAGSWMNEFKIVGGIIEIAAAFKFLAISDFAWEWGFIGRSTTLAVWALLSLFCTLYVSGVIRMPGDSPLERRGAGRLILSAFFAVLALWLLAGLSGFLHLGLVESFFPGDAAPL